MLAEIFLAIILGTMLGAITGIIPGMHVNLLAAILLGLSASLLNYLDTFTLTVFIISVAITHTFINILPGVFLGAPDESNSLAILPSHKMLLDGLGYNAIQLNVIGSLFTMFAVILLIPISIIFLPFISRFLQPLIGWILLGILVLMILRAGNLNSIFWSLIIVLLSGTLGMIVFTTPSMKEGLLPMLSGLFGLSALIITLKTKPNIPEQRERRIILDKKDTIKAVSAATISGAIAGILPGLGSAQAAIISTYVLGKIKEDAVLILLGGINTANFIFSLATLFAIQKARNGAVVAISKLIQLNEWNFTLLIISIIISGSLAAILTLLLGKLFCKIASKIKYSFLIIAVAVILFSFTLYFSSWLGIIVLITATAIGLLPNILGINRSLSMACLIVPVIFYYLL